MVGRKAGARFGAGPSGLGGGVSRQHPSAAHQFISLACLSVPWYVTVNEGTLMRADELLGRARTMPARRAAFAILLALSGCVSTADLTPLNEAASSTGVPQMKFTRRGTSFGPVTITMPDGEVLRGHYQVAQGGGFAVGSATGFGPTGMTSATGMTTAVSAGGNVWVSARGPQTTITCQGQSGWGHGGGICRTNTGAEWQLMF